MTKPHLSSSWKFVIAVLLCEATGIASGLLSRGDTNIWFATLNKPSWNPPDYVFGPVWTILYFLIGVALWLIWKSAAPQPAKRNAILLFLLQLFLNFWWSILFFRFHSPAFAFADILLLLITIVVTLFLFAPISRMAAWLLVPYVLWVSFASVLNYAIWRMN